MQLFLGQEYPVLVLLNAGFNLGGQPELALIYLLDGPDFILISALIHQSVLLLQVLEFRHLPLIPLKQYPLMALYPLDLLCQPTAVFLAVLHNYTGTCSSTPINFRHHNKLSSSLRMPSVLSLLFLLLGGR